MNLMPKIRLQNSKTITFSVRINFQFLDKKKPDQGPGSLQKQFN